jgi:NTP pyrophosphatase (non-canonical NTP hydrolase)
MAMSGMELQRRMDMFQERVGIWADGTFPESDWRSIVAHLQEEVQELSSALYEDADGRGDYREEAADCLLLLLHLAHKEGFSLMASAMKKNGENQRRGWETDDNGRGYWKHIDAPTPGPAREEG